MGESGSVSVHHEWQTVELVGSYTQPVVIAGVPTEHGGQESVVRIRNLRERDPAATNSGEQSPDVCLGWCFQIQIVESACYDGTHATELVPWVVMEAGSYRTDEGVQLQAGVQSGITSERPQTVTFDRDFQATESRPGGTGSRTKAIVVTTLQTTTTQGFLTARSASGGNHDFQVKLMPAVVGATETVGWVATLPSVGHIGSHAFQASMAAERPSQDGWYFGLSFESGFFAGPPRLFAAISNAINPSMSQAQALRLRSEPTSVMAEIFVEDDLCGNQAATTMRETVSFFALQGGGQARLRAVREV